MVFPVVVLEVTTLWKVFAVVNLDRHGVALVRASFRVIVVFEAHVADSPLIVVSFCYLDFAFIDPYCRHVLMSLAMLCASSTPRW